MSSFGLELWMACRYLSNVRREGFVSVSCWFSFLGISLGVATLIIVMSVMNGFRADLLERILGVQGHFTVHARTAEARLGFSDIRLRLLDIGVDEIEQLSPLIDGQVLAASERASDGILLRSLGVDEIRQRDLLRDSVLGGDWSDFESGGGLYLGINLAERLGVSVGDSIKLISPRLSFTGFGSLPRVKTYLVGGIFSVGMYQYDNNVAFLPLVEGRRFFNVGGDGYYALEGLLSFPERAGELASEWDDLLGSHYSISDWQNNNSALVSALKIERNVMFIILTLIILVAAFNIIAGQVMLVRNKSRAIAIMRSFGGQRLLVMRIFLLCGSLIGFAGTFVGAFFGIIFALNIEHVSNFIESVWDVELFSGEIYYLSQLPSRVYFSDVFLVCVMAFVISLGAALYPALRASRVSPAEELRYE